jgi:hypothetical protein
MARDPLHTTLGDALASAVTKNKKSNQKKKRRDSRHMTENGKTQIYAHKFPNICVRNNPKKEKRGKNIPRGLEARRRVCIPSPLGSPSPGFGEHDGLDSFENGTGPFSYNGAYPAGCRDWTWRVKAPKYIRLVIKNAKKFRKLT